MEASEVAIIIGAVGTMVVSVFVAFGKWSANNEKIAEKARVAAQERASSEREMMSKLFGESLKMLSEATERNTKAQERTADEAKQRNGHLAEIMVEAKNSAIDVAIANRAIYEAGFKELKCQNVKKQTVDEQIVKHSTKE